MNWTEERVEQLKKLWAEGLSASQIATQMGGVSRNAVIGKVHRLKLSSRGKTSPNSARPKKAAQPTPPPQQPAATRPTPRPTPSVAQSTQKSSPSAPVRTVAASVGATALQTEFQADAVASQVLRPTEDVVVPISRKLKLIQLSERTCKWPIGDPLAEDFHFCGNDSDESTPYCKYHAKLAFQPVSERRRAR